MHKWHETEPNIVEGQSQEEEDEEKMPCPICQRVFPLHHIEVHASDCMGVEEDSQQEQHQQQQQQQQLQQQQEHCHQQQKQKEQQQQQYSLSTHGRQTRRRKRDESEEPAENGPTSHLQEESLLTDSQEMDSHLCPASPVLNTQGKTIYVFSRGAGHTEAPLSRRRPLCSEAPGTALHPLPNETLQQARVRITAMLDSTSKLLLQHKASQLPRAWSLPLTVNSQLRDSLDKPQSPPPRVIGRRRPLRERRQKEQLSQAAQGSPVAPQADKGQEAPEEAEEAEEALVSSRKSGIDSRVPTSVIQRLSQARVPGLQGATNRKRALIMLPKVSSGSDTDVEVSSSQEALALPPAPSPLRAAGGTVSGCQPQSSSGRRTFSFLDSDSEGEECYMKSDLVSASGPVLEKGTSSPQPSSSGQQQQQQQQQRLTDLDAAAPSGVRRAAAQRGRRRPAAPDPKGPAASKHRKTHTASSGQELPTGTSDEEENESLLQAAGIGNKWSTEQRQSLEEEEEEEENIPCPMCQKLFPVQHIEVHASDCMGVEEDTQQEHHDLDIVAPMTRRRLRFKPPEDESKMRRLDGRSLSQKVSQIKKEFSQPDSHLGTEDIRPSSPEY